MVLAGALLAAPASAQQAPVDWCNSPLPSQADPGTALVWRLRCTVQILDRERFEAMDHATTVEIDKAVAEAHLREALGQIDELKKAKEPSAPEATTVLPPHKDK